MSVTTSAVACNGQIYIAGTDSGLVVALAAQKKAAPSTKTEVQPSYIATHHARRVTCIATTDETFATASDDCTIVVSQIGGLFNGDAVNKASRLRYRITGAHALPVTGLAYVPSDSNLLASASADGTLVVHRLHFVAGSASALSALPSLALAQSMEKMVKLPFSIAAICPITPSDGTLLAAAGLDEEGVLKVALVDIGVAQRDGNGTGRPLQPFAILSTASAVKDVTGIAVSCVGDALVVSYAAAKDAAAATVQWALGALLKAMAIGRAEEEVVGDAPTKKEGDDEAEAEESPKQQEVSFIGTAEQVKNAMTAITAPDAKPNDYYASLYVNFCWSSWSRPAACVAPVAPKQTVVVAKKSAVSDSDSDDEEVGVASAPGFGKRARKTKARLNRAEAEAAEWARLALAIDGIDTSSVAVGVNAKEVLPCRYTQLNAARSVAACDSVFSYAPVAQTIGSSSSIVISAADEEEAACAQRLSEQTTRNKAIQARIDALYAAVSSVAGAVKEKGSKAGAKDASPKGRATKKHVAEASSPAGKSVFSLT